MRHGDLAVVNALTEFPIACLVVPLGFKSSLLLTCEELGDDEWFVLTDTTAVGAIG